MTTLPLAVGPELDLWIAEHIVGAVPCRDWTVQQYTIQGPIWMSNGACGHGGGGCFPVGCPANFSTNLAAAWSVWAQICEATSVDPAVWGWSFPVPGDPNRLRISYTRAADMMTAFTVESATPAEAICRAAQAWWVFHAPTP